MKFRLPHTLALLIIVMAMALVLTWILPPGAFQMATTPAGKSVVVAGTFSYLPERTYLPPWSLFTVIPRALAEVQGVIFFIMLTGGAFGVVRHTEAIEAGIGRVMATFQDRQGLLIFCAMTIFASLSAFFGMASEYLPFVALLVSVCAAMRLCAMTAAGVLLVGYGVGYGASILNPFTILIAQDIADVPLGSGAWFRAGVFAIALALGFHHVWRYARRVRLDPSCALADVPEPAADTIAEQPALTTTRKLVLVTLGLALLALMAGVGFSHWSMPQLGALFLALAVAVTLVARVPVDDACRAFIGGVSRLAGVAILIGIARAIGLLLEDGQVLHTLVHLTSAPLAAMPDWLAAIGMFLMQSFINFFIPSGSGQAFATMPIMAPIADVTGLSRQVSVLAFQFGDGFTNLVVPTNAYLMAVLGLAGVSYANWIRFVWPLFLKLMLLSAAAVAIAVPLGL